MLLLLLQAVSSLTCRYNYLIPPKFHPNYHFNQTHVLTELSLQCKYSPGGGVHSLLYKAVMLWVVSGRAQASLWSPWCQSETFRSNNNNMKVKLLLLSDGKIWEFVKVRLDLLRHQLSITSHMMGKRGIYLAWEEMNEGLVPMVVRRKWTRRQAADSSDETRSGTNTLTSLSLQLVYHAAFNDV